MDASHTMQVVKEALNPALDDVQNSADILQTNMLEGLEWLRQIKRRPPLDPKASDDDPSNDGSTSQDATEESANGNIPAEESASDKTFITSELQRGANVLNNWSQENPVKMEKIRMAVLADILSSAAKALQIDLKGEQNFLDAIMQDASKDVVLREWYAEATRLKQEEERLEAEEKEEKERVEAEEREKEERKAWKRAEKRERRREKKKEKRKAKAEAEAKMKEAEEEETDKEE